MLKCLRLSSRVVAAIVLVASNSSVSGQQSPASNVTLVGIASGPQGADVAGEYHLTEERRTFSRSMDRQVVVSFRWRGTPGIHRLAARWRAPNGGATQSELDYTARNSLFGAYWTMPLSSATPTGSWMIEATVDGLPAGSLAFEVTDATVPASFPEASLTEPDPASTAPVPLGRAEMYERLSRHFSYVERLTGQPRERSAAAAATVSPGQSVTVLAALDETDGIRRRTSQGTVEQTAALLGWDADAGWAVIGRNSNEAGLTLADPASVRIGDPCYSMNGTADGTRVLAECSVTGRNDAPGRGSQWVVSFVTAPATPGAAVVDRFGHVIGLASAGSAAPVPIDDLLRLGGDAGRMLLLRVPPALPEGAEPVAIGELRRRGVLRAPVRGAQHLLTAGFSAQRRGAATRDYRDTFNLRERQVFVVVTWDPKERIRGNMILQLYSKANQLLIESKPKKVDLRPGRDTGGVSEFTLSTPPTAGTYRVDLLIDGTIMWRREFNVE